MSGGYSRIRIDPIAVVDGARNPVPMEGAFFGGIKYQESPLNMDLASSPDLESVRVRDQILLGDFVPLELGSAAPGRIATVGFLGDNTSVIGLDIPTAFRVWENTGTGQLELDEWNQTSLTWVANSTFPVGFSPPAEDEDYIDWYPTLGVVLFAYLNNEVAIWDGSSISLVSGVTAGLVAGFADRAIGLRANGDVQVIRYSVNGIPTDWAGVGSGEAILQSNSKVDPVDPLMSLVPITSDIAVLFRRSTIWRVNRTGSGQAPLAFTPWIDTVGLRHLFGAKSVPGGVIFMGSDDYIHLLTESGITSLGRLPIPDRLPDYGGPQTVYHPKVGEFKISDRNGLGNAEGIYTLDFGEYIRSNRIVWTFRDDGVLLANPAAAPFNPDPVNAFDPVELIYSDGNSVFMAQYDLSSFGYWRSPTLNRENPFAAYALNRLIVKYRDSTLNAAVTNMNIRGSGDGGRTWTDAIDTPGITTPNVGDDPAIRRIAFHWDPPISGEDIRFEVSLTDENAVIALHSWRAELVDLGDSTISASGRSDV